MGRNKIVSIRVNEALFNKFLHYVDKYTKVYECEYVSRIENYYSVCFPNRPYSGRGKYTLADFVEEKLRGFIAEMEQFDNLSSPEGK